MFAQPNQSRQTYVQYSDGGGTESGDQVRPSVNQRLLQEVLGETLIRNQENSEQLIETLRRFCQQHSPHPFDEALLVMIAEEVLRHRLGERSRQLPRDLYNEVGRALWVNDESRKRIERFWNALGADS